MTILIAILAFLAGLAIGPTLSERVNKRESNFVEGYLDNHPEEAMELYRKAWAEAEKNRPEKDG